MASWKSRTSRAAALHRQAATVVTAAASALDATRPAPADQGQQYDLAERLRVAASLLAPGWLGADLDKPDLAYPGPATELPRVVRIGVGKPLDDAPFPALVPLLGTGHLAVDSDAHEPRAAALLRNVVLRLLATAPTGSLLVRAVDGTETGVFDPFASLADAGLLPPPAVDRAGMEAVLSEAEQWIVPGGPNGRRRNDRILLLVIATLPVPVSCADLLRIGRLAEHGPGAGLHLVVAGWPAPGTESDSPLPLATPVTLRNAYALVGDPPGATFGSPGARGGPSGLNSPVFLDPAPATPLIERVCRELTRRVDGHRPMLADLLSDVMTEVTGMEAEPPRPVTPLWGRQATDGLVTSVGHADGRIVKLGFTDITPHWMISGRPGSGKTAFLTNVLFGLAARYGPAELALYLIDLAEGEAFADFLPTEHDPAWLPQVRAAGMQADHEYVLAVLADLDTELSHRIEACQRTGATRFAELRQHEQLPRIVCVVENFPLLLSHRPRLANRTRERLESLARRCRGYGIHLLLAGRGALTVGSGSAAGDSMLGQFPVRVALPGGGEVLAPTNDAAASLPFGAAVVNTAGGLGGPRGATRGHERTVRFPDPEAEPQVINALRQRLWSDRPTGAYPPIVFAGYALPRLVNDPAYRAALAGTVATPTALLGRAVDVARSSVGFPFAPESGRHLAVLGTTAARGMLATAARTLAAHHRPGEARFLVAALEADSESAAAALVAALGDRQKASLVDQAGIVKAIDTDEPAYLVIFDIHALDAAELPADRLRQALRDGPARGLHLLACCGDIRRLTAYLGEAVEAGELAGIVALDVPGGQLAGLLGRPVEWQPRQNRALSRDMHTDSSTVLVPYAESEVGC